MNKGIIFTYKKKTLRMRLQSKLRNITPTFYANYVQRPFPITLQIQTTSLCNADCVFCPYPETSEKLSMGSMDDDLFKKIIDECSQHNSVRTIIPFLMADPFIDKKMTEKIFYIKEKIPFAAIRLSSNGGPLVPKIAEKIADSPLDSMTFNVPGYYKETYESMITKVPYDKMKENISYYLKLPKKYNTEVEMNIVQNNQISDKEVDEYCDYWTGLGANINVTRITNRAGAINDESLLTYDKNEQSKPLKGCELDRQLKMFHILYNGDVNLCCMDWNREEILGNVMEHSIEEVWNSKPYNEIRKKLLSKIAYSDDFICNRCSEAVR